MQATLNAHLEVQRSTAMDIDMDADNGSSASTHCCIVEPVDNALPQGQRYMVDRLQDKVGPSTAANGVVKLRTRNKLMSFRISYMRCMSVVEVGSDLLC